MTETNNILLWSLAIIYLGLNLIDSVQTMKLFKISAQAEANWLLRVVHRVFGMAGV